MSRLIKSIAVFALTGIAFLLAAELVLWFLFDIKPPQFRPDRLLSTDSLLGHYHRPHARGYWYRYTDGSRFWVEINRWGLSDADRPLDKTRPRIALIGDSTTENWEMPEAQRSHNVLHNLLDKQVEVLNCGVRGYGTDQALILLRHVVARFQPDIVVYFFCINDINDNWTRTAKPFFTLDDTRPGGLVEPVYPITYGERPSYDVSIRSPREYLAYYSFFWRNVSLALSALAEPYRRPKPLEEMFELRPYLKKYTAEDESKWELTLRLIRMMKSFCDAHGIRFIAVYGPHRVELDQDLQEAVKRRYGDLFDFDKMEAQFLSGCKTNGIEALGLKGEIRKRGLQWRRWFHREDNIHLNEVGVEEYCGILRERLSALGWCH